MEKYELNIPDEIAFNVCEFYNESNSKILTVNTLKFLVSQGAICIIETIGKKVITGISVYFIIQSIGSSVNKILSSRTLRKNSSFRTPVSLNSKVEGNGDITIVKYRYVVFEAGKIEYPESYIKNTVSCTTGKDIQLYSSPATSSKNGGYEWINDNDGYYTLYYHKSPIGKVMTCIGYRKCLELLVMQFDCVCDISVFVSQLSRLAYLRGAKQVVIPQYPKLQKVPVINYLEFHKSGYNKCGTLGISNLDVTIPWII